MEFRFVFEKLYKVIWALNAKYSYEAKTLMHLVESEIFNSCGEDIGTSAHVLINKFKHVNVTLADDFEIDSEIEQPLEAIASPSPSTPPIFQSQTPEYDTTIVEILEELRQSQQ